MLDDRAMSLDEAVEKDKPEGVMLLAVSATHYKQLVDIRRTAELLVDERTLDRFADLLNAVRGGGIGSFAGVLHCGSGDR